MPPTAEGSTSRNSAISRQQVRQSGRRQGRGCRPPWSCNSSREAAQQSVRRLLLLLLHCVCESAQEELGVLGLQEISGSEPRGRLDMNPSDSPWADLPMSVPSSPTFGKTSLHSSLFPRIDGEFWVTLFCVLRKLGENWRSRDPRVRMSPEFV